MEGESLTLKNVQKDHISFKNYCVIETGLSYFHKVTFVVKKTTYEILKLKITDRDCKTNFSKVYQKKTSIQTVSRLENF